VWRLGELNVGISHHLDTVSPRIQEVKERPVDHPRASGERKVADLLTVVDDEAEVTVAVLVRVSCLGQRQELIVHVDKCLSRCGQFMFLLVG
jgi:hypothetical protein